MVNSKRKARVAMLSILSNTTLIILKVIAGILSGSVSIISEAIHSSMDLAASLIAYVSVRISSKPADESHQYGHGKVENVSGVVEGLLIFVAAFLIIKEALEKVLHPTELRDTGVAIVVMLISAVANVIVSKMLYKVAKEEDSVALEADALHLKTDVYTSLGVAVGLLLIKLTGIAILDPIVAIFVACLIINEAWHLSSSAFSPLLDASLTKEEQEKIKTTIKSYCGRIEGYHNLRTRKAGNIRHIDFHMFVDGEMSVNEAHALCEAIENDIEIEIKYSNVNIHVEPLNEKESSTI